MEALYIFYNDIINSLSNFLYTYFLIFLLVASGIYFTIRMRLVQFRYLKESLRVVMQPSPDKANVSAFQTLMVSTASRVGTGNIAGVATAICIGGVGSVFWMWVTALCGSATAFAEGTLAQIYKKRAADGSCYGGPAYYIEQTIKKRGLGVLFAVVMILTYMVGFNLVASFNIADSFKVYSFYNPSVTPAVVGAVTAALFLLCISGGGRRIASVTAVMVPAMGIFYIAVTLYVMVSHITLLPSVFAGILKNAFDFEAIFGGFVGSAVMQGVKRGLFSNEAGIGAAACAAGSAGVSHPVKQGLVQVLSVFIDTMVICTATAMLLLCSGVEFSAEIAGMPYAQAAVKNILGDFGVIFITVALFLFAFTTLLGNYYYAETGLSYLFKEAPSLGAKYIQRGAATLVVAVGAVLQLSTVWNTADVLMGLMAIINIPVIIYLLKPTLLCLNDYTKQKLEGKDPVFKASDIGLKEKTDFWQ